MPIPAAIEKVLSRHKISFVSDRACSEGVQTRLLKDTLGKLQVIYPDHSLLDLDAVCRLTDRNLTPVSQEDLEALCQKLQLNVLPALPGVLNIPAVIDTGLLNSSELVFEVDPDEAIALDGTSFKQLIDESLTGSIAVNETHLQHSALDDAGDVDDISAAIANFTQLRIKQRLEETLEFPPLPETAQKIIKLRVDPNADIKDLTNIVETDPALAAQVVSWASSPYYAAPGKIKSVHDAIVRVLGFDLVLNLSLGLSLGKALNLPKDQARGFTPYWKQSVYAAASMEALVGAISPQKRPMMGLCYLAGLLHNFGYLILAEVFPPHFSSICRYQEANPFSNHCHIERHLLGISREQLAAWLLRLWNLPEQVCIGLRFQQEPGYGGEHNSYANLLYIAMRLLRQHGIGDAPLTDIDDAVYERLGLDRGKAEQAIARVMEGSAELNEMAANLAA